MDINKIYCGDALQILKSFPDNAIDCSVTSPPYFGLRDYGVYGQIGLEHSPEEYINRLLDIFSEVYRVLKPEGTLWLNIGDSYAGRYLNFSTDKIKPKDLIGIPWMLAFALRERGWYLRQDIIWAKPNPMPESVKDRCTKSHEYIFLLSKRSNYYFDGDAINEPIADSTAIRMKQNIAQQHGSDRVPGKTNGTMKAVINSRYGGKKYTEHPDIFNRTKSGKIYVAKPMRNRRDVWNISTKPYKGAHFSTFPIELITPCIKAGCPKGGIVLDPFMGSGTTGCACKELRRNYIGIDINEQYCGMAEDRIANYANQIKLEDFMEG